jgi:hypothetical protein
MEYFFEPIRRSRLCDYPSSYAIVEVDYKSDDWSFRFEMM